MNVSIEPGWHAQLQELFSSESFRQTAEAVRAQYRSGEKIYPPASQIFRAFDCCGWGDVKVVIIGQDPYHGPGQANGLCFSVNEGAKLPPSLVNIYKEIAAETGNNAPRNGDLTRWANQGVLLLNSTLTVRQHCPGSHATIGWEHFTDAVVRILSERKENLVFMLWGSHAIRKGISIDTTRHLVLTSAHPSPLSAYRGFFGNGHFIKANKYLASHHKKTIDW